MTDLEKMVNDHHDEPTVRRLERKLSRYESALDKRGRQIQNVIYTGDDAVYTFRWTAIVILLLQTIALVLMLTQHLDSLWTALIVWGLFSVAAYNAGRCAALKKAKQLIFKEEHRDE